MAAEFPEYGSLLVELRDGVAEVTLNRPDALNSFNDDLKADAADAWRRIPQIPEVRAVLLTGAGRAFSAGGDIKQMSPDRGAEATRRRMSYLLREVVIPLTRLEVPVVAAVNGHAHGLGLGIALACDIIYCAEGAKLSMAFTRVGLAPDGGASYFLPRIVGLNRAKELIFTARNFSPAEAYDMGIVNRVLPDDDLLSESRKLAAELAAGPTVALGAAKRSLNEASLRSIEEVAQIEAYGQALAMTSDDHREGIAAFAERRPAKFTGR